MATMYKKTIVQISPASLPDVQEEYNGHVNTYHEVGVKVAGNQGPEDLILRTGSQRLIDKLVVGAELKGYLFQDSNAAVYPHLWRFKVTAKDNLSFMEPPLYAAHGAQNAQSRGGEGDRMGWTFKAFSELLAACYDEARRICGAEFSDVALQATAVALFTACCHEGIRGASSEARPAPGTASTSMNNNMAVALMDAIEPVIKKSGLWTVWQNSNMPDEEVIKLRNQAGGNEAKLAIDMNRELSKAPAQNAAAPAGAPAKPNPDDEALPF